jgi:hypothetical protein
MNSLRFLSLAVVAHLVLCCTQAELPQGGATPQIEDVRVETVGTDCALLWAEVSDGRLAAVCGFHVYQTGSTQALRYETACEGNEFSALADGLRPDTGYEFEAFVENGKGLSVKSKRVPFATLAGEPGEPSYAFSFETFLLREFDKNHDGILSTEEALAVRKMTVHTDSIPSINHLERFQNLDTLTCRPHRMTYKSLLKELDLSGNPAMRYLNAIRNDMETISFPKDSELRFVNIGFNNFVTLDLSTLLKAEYVNLTGCHRLKTVYLAKGQSIRLTTDSSSSFKIIYYDE